MGLSRQEYWSGLSFPSPGDLPDPGIKPESLTSPTWAGGFFTTAPRGGFCNRENVVTVSLANISKGKQKVFYREE